MKRYTMAYVLWLIALTAVCAIMLEWYRRVEGIGWTEVGARLRNSAPTTEDPPADDAGE